MVVYELHVRDFSINDATVSAPHRGKYAAFGETGSNGMKHLAALSRAGLTDIHLLPVYDIGSVPEKGCAMPAPAGAPDSEAQQALVKADRRNRLLQLGLRPVPLQRAGRQLLDRSGRRRAPHRRNARDGDEPAPHRPAGRHGRRLQPHLHRRPERKVGARPDRARLLPPPERGRRDRTLDLLRQHRHRKPHDGQADGRFGGAVGDPVQDRFVPLRPDGTPAARRDGAAAAARRRRRRPPRAADRRRLELRRGGRRRALRAGVAAVAERQRHRHLQRPRARLRARRLGQRRGRQDDQAAGLHQWPGVRPQRAGRQAPGGGPAARGRHGQGGPGRIGAQLPAGHAATARRTRCRTSTTAASRPATPASLAKRSTTSRTTTTRRCTTSTCSSCRWPPPAPSARACRCSARRSTPSARAWPTSTPASTRCARSRSTATASIRATGSTASTGATRTITSAPARRRPKTTKRTTR